MIGFYNDPLILKNILICIVLFLFLLNLYVIFRNQYLKNLNAIQKNIIELQKSELCIEKNTINKLSRNNKNLEEELEKSANLVKDKNGRILYLELALEAQEALLEKEKLNFLEERKKTRNCICYCEIKRLRIMT